MFFFEKLKKVFFQGTLIIFMIGLSPLVYSQEQQEEVDLSIFSKYFNEDKTIEEIRNIFTEASHSTMQDLAPGFIWSCQQYILAEGGLFKLEADTPDRHPHLNKFQFSERDGIIMNIIDGSNIPKFFLITEHGLMGIYWKFEKYPEFLHVRTTENHDLIMEWSLSEEYFEFLSETSYSSAYGMHIKRLIKENNCGPFSYASIFETVKYPSVAMPRRGRVTDSYLFCPRSNLKRVEVIPQSSGK